MRYRTRRPSARVAALRIDRSAVTDTAIAFALAMLISKLIATM